MVTVLISGGTGMIGTALSKALVKRGYAVIILTRDGEERKTTNVAITYAIWDINKEQIDVDAIANADHIIHLAGAGVAEKGWTKERKKEIVESRVRSGDFLVKALKQYPNSVQSFVSASAIGWYGADPVVPNPHPFTEEAKPADDFLGTTCKLWEQSVEPVTQLGKRLVFLRTGIVLSKEGGALKEFIKPLKFGVAASMGSGRQVMSWIAIDDIVEMYIAAIENEKMSGAYNAVAPFPVTNKQLVRQLAKSKKKKFYIPVAVPSLLLKLVLGEMSTEVLKSATVSSGKIQATGFQFKQPSLQQALDHLLA